MIVLDAAALVDAVVGTSRRDWVLEQLDGEQIVAPAHQPAEVLSAVARLARGGTIDGDAAVAAVRAARELEQDLVVPTAAHLTLALEHHDRIRVLDGLYLALAADHGCPVVTTDRRLARSSPPVEVRAPGT